MPFRVTMMLADAAQAAENKLYVLGGGWDVIGPAPSPFAIAMLIQVPWDLTNRRHQWQLVLVDADGNPVILPTPMGGEEPVAIEGEFEVGRPAGVAPGSWLAIPVAIMFAPLPLEPGGRYEWRLTVSDESDENWRLPFAVRPPAPPQG
ncbi:MAG: hypothetical protein AABM30_09305 [Actinomycetota bacterium]